MRTTSLKPIHTTALQLSAQSVQSAEKLVLSACLDAATTESDYVQKAATAGALLFEFREAMKMSCHRDNSCTNVHIKHWNDRAKQDGFKAWLERQGIPQRRAYRWMAVAEAVARGILHIPAALPFDGSIDIEGIRIPVSQALTAPEAELPQGARDFRQSYFDFLQDKTLAEATRAAVDGESPAHRITKAAAGKLSGGHNGEDRKDYPTFIARKLSDISTHLASWNTYTPGQRQKTIDAFGMAATKWPTPFLEDLQTTIKSELKNRP